MDGAISKALAKDPADRFERCVDFARALSHRVAGGTDATRLSAAAPVRQPQSRSLLRPVVLIPVVLALLLIGAIIFAGIEFREDRPTHTATPTQSPAPTTTQAPATTATTTASPLPAPPPPPETTSTAPATPPAVIGASCPSAGSTGTTTSGATAYCSTLQPSGNMVWSLHPGDVSIPDPLEREREVRVCMDQTGQTRLRCREDIRRSNMGG
jgi:serine/threonine protein kinase, bacterial